jgi:hypothetical protein
MYSYPRQIQHVVSNPCIDDIIKFLANNLGQNNAEYNPSNGTLNGRQILFFWQTIYF